MLIKNIILKLIKVKFRKEQYFYTGMDTYIHSFKSLNGSYRHAVGDFCILVYNQYMTSDENREKLMTV